MVTEAIAHDHGGMHGGGLMQDERSFQSLGQLSSDGDREGSPGIQRWHEALPHRHSLTSPATKAEEQVGKQRPGAVAVLAALASGRWNRVLATAGVDPEQLNSMQRAAASHWQLLGPYGTAQTVRPSSPSFLFGTPSPPPPCRSVQDKAILADRRMYAAQAEADAIQARRLEHDRKLISQRSRRPTGQRHEYVKPFTAPQHGGSDRTRPTADRSAFERSIGSVFSARHGTTVPAAGSLGPLTARPGTAPEGCVGSGPLRPKQLADRQRQKPQQAQQLQQPRPPPPRTRPMTSSGLLGVRQARVQVTARPSTVSGSNDAQEALDLRRPITAPENVAQPRPPGPGTDRFAQPRPAEAFSFLLQNGGGSSLSLEAFDAAPRSFIVPAQVAPLVVLPSKLRVPMGAAAATAA